MNRTPDPTQTPELELDFVTPHHVEHCRERLTRPPLAGSYQVYTGEGARFTVEWGRRGTWPQSSDAGIVLQFIGYLEPVDGGTRVHGAVTDASRRVAGVIQQLAMVVAIGSVIAVIAALVLAGVSSASALLPVVGLVSVGLGVYAVLLRRALGRLAPWVREQLSSPPGEPDKAEPDA